MDRLRSWLDPGAPSSTRVGIAAAAVAAAAITLLIFPLKRLVAAPSLDALYVPAVLFLSIRWTAWIAGLAAVLSALAFSFFHITPVHTFSGLFSEGISFLVVAAAAVYVASLSSRVRLVEERRQQEVASRARVVAAADAERRRVVRDLHDGAQQRLVHAVITLKLALRELKGADLGAAELVDEALQNAEQANHELRELAHGILPSALTRGGLREGVEALVPRISVPVSADVTSERFSEGVEASAYFIVSEALTNVVKHARAKVATVTAWVERGALRIEIRDDGVGGARSGGTPGLGGLEDRVSALGGRLVIESPRGRGTRVLALLPLPDQRVPPGESRK